MKSKRVIAISVVAVATLVVLTGLAFALVQVTRDVDATVDVQVIAPDGIEIFLDEALTQAAGTVEFGSVDVDPFGTLVEDLNEGKELQRRDGQLSVRLASTAFR